jgi:hypothetical protein
MDNLQIIIKGIESEKEAKYVNLFRYLIETDALEVFTGQTVIHWADGYLRRADRLINGKTIAGRNKIKKLNHLAELTRKR